MIEVVIKRDGSEEPFNEDKLNKWAEYAAKHQVPWSQLAKDTYIRLENRCSTEDIHETMIKVCLSKEDINWSRVAARLEFATIRAGMKTCFGHDDRTSFKEIFNSLISFGYWDKDTLPEYNPVWEEWYKDVYNNRLEFWQVKQWNDKYAIKEGGLILETPHIASIGIGLAIHGDTEDAFIYAKSIIEGKLNLPTPVLNGCRNGDFDGISCCVISGGDSVESIEVAKHIATRMTAKKAGIGIEYTTRTKGSNVKGGRVKHLGKTPIYAALDKAVKMFTQVTRGGSATTTFNCIDPEIESLLLLKSQRTPENMRIDKLDYSMAYNEAFVDAVVNNEDWHLYDYLTSKPMYDNFHLPADEYKALQLLHAPKSSINARALLKTFLTVRSETGRVYCVNLTRANEHTPFVDPIKLSNLCVAPETQILTDKGYKVISELEEQVVNVWNGEEFSRTTVHKTGTDQELVKVITDSGQMLECTPYHKFYLADGYSGKKIMKRAHELVAGDKLIKFDLPVIKGTKELSKAYQNGFYSADGCSVNGDARIYLYGEKKKLEPMFNLSKRQENTKQDRVYGIEEGLKDKFFVPDTSYSIQSRLDWLAGYMDGDGCIYRNGNNEQLVASGVEPEFLKELQLMLQTLGIDSKVQLMSEAGLKPLPKNDGTDQTGLYDCKASYRVIINSNGLFKLHQLGINFRRLVTTKRLPQRSASHFIKVVNVEETGRIDDTYCFTESKRGMGMFGGILTGQCQEIFLPTKAYRDMYDLYGADKSIGETAFCSLSAINVSACEPEEIEELARIAVYSVNKLIDLAPMMTGSMKESILRRRSIGIGITGLAGALYKKGLDYDSPETLQVVSEIAERHAYYLYKASCDYAYDYKVYVGGITDWLPIDTRKGNTELKLDWESLRGIPRANSVLIAHMPTESSAVFSNATNGLYPVRSKITEKFSRKGKVQFIAPAGNYKLAWDHDNNTLSAVYGIVQDFSDQGISADYYVVPTRYPGGKVPLGDLVKQWITQARRGNKSMYYINTNDYTGGSFQDMVETMIEDDGCASGACKL